MVRLVGGGMASMLYPQDEHYNYKGLYTFGLRAVRLGPVASKDEHYNYQGLCVFGLRAIRHRPVSSHGDSCKLDIRLDRFSKECIIEGTV